MRIVAIFLMTAALCFVPSVDVSWQNDAVEVAMQETLAAETTCGGCSDCFKDNWGGAGEECHSGSDNWECGLIQQTNCELPNCQFISCHRPCYDATDTNCDGP